MEKIKVNDVTQVNYLREILDNHLSQLANELTSEEVVSGLMQYVPKDEKPMFKEIISNVPQEVFDKILKRIKSQIKQTLKFLLNSIEEEPSEKDNGIQIIKEDKDENLSKKINDKTERLKGMIEKIKVKSQEKEQFFLEEAKGLFEKFSLPPSNLEPKIHLVNSEKGMTLKFEELVSLLVEKKEQEGIKFLSKMMESYEKENDIEKKLFEEYKSVEEEFLKQSQNYEILRKGPQKKEQLLIKSNILF